MKIRSWKSQLLVVGFILFVLVGLSGCGTMVENLNVEFLERLF